MKTVLLAVAMVGVTALVGCERTQSTSDKQEQVRAEISARANDAVPVPQINNFVMRDVVAEYMKRMDQPNKLFYIYIVADTGNIIGYYVSKGSPANSCLNMTPPDRVDHQRNDPDLLRTAPSLNGLYNAGGGVCNTDYFFDANSGALIKIKGLNMFVSDQPLDLDVEPINVAENS